MIEDFVSRYQTARMAGKPLQPMEFVSNFKRLGIIFLNTHVKLQTNKLQGVYNYYLLLLLMEKSLK